MVLYWRASQTGGHLSSNLGTVELTVALHHVFNTPEDRLVWDVGHQTYPHKILTGRRDRMHTCASWAVSLVFPQRAESPYDTFGTAHSSTSISAALGMAMAAKRKGEDRYAVAIIGDGAMTAGMAFEALNNGGVTDANLLVILNDNDMSISPPVGALNRTWPSSRAASSTRLPRMWARPCCGRFRRCWSWPSALNSRPRAWWCQPRCLKSSASTTSAPLTGTTWTR